MVKFADDAVALLVKEHGYIAAPTRKTKADGNGHDTGPGASRTGVSLSEHPTGRELS